MEIGCVGVLALGKKGVSSRSVAKKKNETRGEELTLEVEN